MMGSLDTPILELCPGRDGKDFEPYDRYAVQAKREPRRYGIRRLREVQVGAETGDSDWS